MGDLRVATANSERSLDGNPSMESSSEGSSRRTVPAGTRGRGDAGKSRLVTEQVQSRRYCLPPGQRGGDVGLVLRRYENLVSRRSGDLLPNRLLRGVTDDGDQGVTSVADD